MTSSDTIVKLQTQISEIEKSGGDSVPIEIVKEMMVSLLDMLNADDGTHNTAAELYSEVGQVAIFLNSAKKEMSKMGDDQHNASESVIEASDHLAATIEMTEQATDTIMSSTEKIQEISAGLPIENEVNELAMKIFEACNFQDITGQRIKKVAEVLQRVEQMILRMVLVFGLSTKGSELDEAKREELEEDACLLNGPALEGQGLEQGQIDDILSTLLDGKPDGNV